ncbi:IS3 family transposase [Runella sp. CRIBMP]|uniref:IS3 family transposase n=1 Tax=Runella sp. CRIBMP TaxID=2683261 RepID=UPI0038F7BFFC
MKAELDMPKGGYENLEMHRSNLFEYIDGYYNIRRLHSGLSYLNPVAVEELYYKNAG